MSLLAALLARAGSVRELEHLATQLVSVRENSPDPWVAMAYFCQTNRKPTRALHFAHKVRET